MNRLFRMAGLCALCLLLVVLVIPSAAQYTSPQSGSHDMGATSDTAATRSSDTTKSSSADTDTGVIPGTGLTAVELKELGYSQRQIAELQNISASGSLASNDTTVSGQQASSGAAGQADINRGNVPDNRAAGTNPATTTSTGGGGWGLWGLVGLLGLLGLGRGRRVETIRRPEDRDIRRVA